MSATRPWVDAFADEMEAKLDENRHKGDRDGWRNDRPEALFRRLMEEAEELARLLHIACDHCGRRAALPGKEPKVRKRDIRREAADVANFAMMIADVAGGMKPNAKEEPRS